MEKEETEDKKSNKNVLYLRFPKDRPSSTEEIMALHPDILSVDCPPTRNKRYCYVKFADNATANKAQSVLSDMAYKDQGHLYAENKYISISESEQRCLNQKLLVTGLPSGVTGEECKLTFPTCIWACPRKGRKVILCFNSEKDAEAILGNKECHKIKGVPVEVERLTEETKDIENESGSGSDDESDEPYYDESWNEEESRRTLFIQFETDLPSPEEIMDLHPDILHIDYPEKPNLKFCYLIFAHNDKATHARNALSNMPYKDKGQLFVQFKRRWKFEISGVEVIKKRLVCLGLRPGTTNEQLREAFPACVHARVYGNRGTARLIFTNEEDVAAIMSDKDSHKVNGNRITLNYLSKPVPIGGKKRWYTKYKMKLKREQRKQYHNSKRFCMDNSD